MLVYVETFSYMSYAVLCGEFLLHGPCCFMWGVSLTRLLLFPVGSFSYTLHAVVCRVFLLHASCCSMLGVSLTRSVLFYVGSFSYMPLLFYVRSLSYTPSAILRVCLTVTHPVLFCVWSSSYTPCAVLCEECFLHTPFYFVWGICRTPLLLFYVGSFYFM